MLALVVFTLRCYTAIYPDYPELTFKRPLKAKVS